MVEDDIDDTEFFTDGVSQYCKEASIVFYQGVPAVLQALESSNTFPDCLITDLQLPGTSGLELVKAIRAHPTWKALPVIIVSSGFTVGEKKEADLLSVLLAEKPASSAELKDMLHDWICAIRTAREGALVC